MKVEITKNELDILIGNAIHKRAYARDCRSTQKDMMAKYPEERENWERRWKEFDSLYKYWADRRRRLIKDLDSAND